MKKPKRSPSTLTALSCCCKRASPAALLSICNTNAPRKNRNVPSFSSVLSAATKPKSASNFPLLARNSGVSPFHPKTGRPKAPNPAPAHALALRKNSMSRAVPLTNRLLAYGYGPLVAILYFLSYPFLFVLGYALCVWASFSLLPFGTDALVVRTNFERGTESLSRIMSVLQTRAIVLNFSERKSWPKWSLPIRLFWRFGPISTLPQFTEFNLPAVILLRRFRFPLTFTFGGKHASAEMDRFLKQVLTPPA